jgi:rhodanese-related sulfurtransferase
MKVSLVCLFTLIVSVLSVYSAEEKFTVLSSDQFKAMLNARTGTEYQKAHIVGAISIPDNKFEEFHTLLKLAYPFIAQTKFVDWKQASMPVER